MLWAVDRTRASLRSLAVFGSLGIAAVGGAPVAAADLATKSFEVDSSFVTELWSRVADSSPAAVSLPLAQNDWAEFLVEEVRIMEPALARKFADIRAFRGTALDDSELTVRFELTSRGFFAGIRSTRGRATGGRSAQRRLVIRPSNDPGSARYSVSPWVADPTRRRPSLECSAAAARQESSVGRSARAGVRIGESLRTFRAAIAATAEFTALHGDGTVEGGLGAVVSVLNRVNAIYEREASIRFILVDGNDSLIYTDAASDPYTTEDSSLLLEENQSNLDAVIGDENYDLGHLFGAGRGGVVTGEACVGGLKAHAVSNDRFDDLDFFAHLPVAHEIGHQLGAGHTHNSAANLICELVRFPDQAFEPGSGSTLMSYGGLCDPENVVAVSDDYLHGGTLDVIWEFMSTGPGAGCGEATDTGNSPPTVDAGRGYKIPRKTPFVLVGSGSDPDGDPLVFNWEQFDLGPPSPPLTDNGKRPLFRSVPPSPSAERPLPRLADLRKRKQRVGESLPLGKRKLTFRLTARDDRGGVASDTVVLRVQKKAGPFRVEAPRSDDRWKVGELESVEWDVAGTDRKPISCKKVNLRLSFDGGKTFPLELASRVRNDGFHEVEVPTETTKKARVKVSCSGNIFFALTPKNFRIVD